LSGEGRLKARIGIITKEIRKKAATAIKESLARAANLFALLALFGRRRV
jgi:uncharacterized small protein (DUF1192 family)